MPAPPPRTVFCNGRFQPEGEAAVSIFDRGLLFADSVYEVVSVLDGRLLDWNRHMARLARSLGEMGIADGTDWRAVCGQLVAANALAEGTVYLQVSRGVAADRDFLFPPAGTPPTCLAFTQAKALVDSPLAQRGLAVVTRPDLRWLRRDIKTTQLLYASLTKMEARAAGADDAWLVAPDGTVTEGTSQNAHIVSPAGVLVTRPLGHEILPGVTRAALLDVAGALGLPVEERPFSVAEARSASEALVSSATLFVTGVVSIDGAVIGDGRPGPWTRRLRESYIAAMRGS